MFQLTNRVALGQSNSYTLIIGSVLLSKGGFEPELFLPQWGSSAAVPWYKTLLKNRQWFSQKSERFPTASIINFCSSPSSPEEDAFKGRLSKENKEIQVVVTSQESSTSLEKMLLEVKKTSVRI